MKSDSKARPAQELIEGKRFKSITGLVIYDDETFTKPFYHNSDEMFVVWERYNEDVWTEVKERHIHQDLIDIYQDGQAWQYRNDSDADWVDLSTRFVYRQPAWKKDTQYRLHPHNDLIQAHRNGAKIQVYIHGDWVEEPDPDWYVYTQYRIKPITTTVYEWMYKHNSNDNWFIAAMIMSEERAKVELSNYKYRKTGRSWEVEV
jgi:hypothetical protein